MTESQRRLLGDTLSLGSDVDRWEPPSVLPDPQRVARVQDELERGLKHARGEFLKWVADKLAVLPTRNADALTGAYWTDNVIDVCAHYPEDLLQSACLELLRTKTFRPQPAEIVAVIEPRYGERQRMLERCKRLLPPKATPANPTAFESEPEPNRLRHLIWRGWEFRTGLRTGFLGEKAWGWAMKAERDLAAIEGREPAGWASIEGAKFVVAPEAAPKPSAASLRTRARLAELAKARRPVAPQAAPKVEARGDDGYDDVPEGDDFGGDRVAA